MIELLRIRLFWSIYIYPLEGCCYPYFIEQLFQQNINLQILSFDKVLNYYLSSLKENLNIVLHFDEINYYIRETSNTIEKIIRDIASSIYRFKERIILLAVFSGTGTNLTFKNFSPITSQMMPKFLHLNLTQFETVYREIFIKFAGADPTSSNSPEYLPFRRLVSTVAPVPRFIEQLLREMNRLPLNIPRKEFPDFKPFFENIQKINMSEVLSNLVFYFKDSYLSILKETELAKIILLYSFAGIWIPFNFKIQGYSLEELETRFTIFVSYSNNDSCAKIDLPPLLILIFNNYLRLIDGPSYWLTHPEFIQGVIFEEVDGHFESLRSNAFYHFKTSSNTVGS